MKKPSTRYKELSSTSSLFPLKKMTSLLTTAVDESCQSSGILRGRRRSSVRSFSAVPRFFSSQSNTTRQASSSHLDENPIADDIELAPQLSGTLVDGTSGGQATSGLSPQPKGLGKEISPLRHAHLSDYTSKMTVPKHRPQNSLGAPVDFSLCSTPVSGTSTPRMNSRKGSYDDLFSNTHSLQDYGGMVQDQEKFERMKWRLAAGYFAFFLCGWGDGSACLFASTLITITKY